MGAKLYADTAAKRLIVTEAPVAGRVTLNVQVDIWSDLIEDWEGDVDLRKHTFPVVAIGGDTFSGKKLGTTYGLLDPWQIDPDQGVDYELVVEGNLLSSSLTLSVVVPTSGVNVVSEVSTLVERVETGTSGLTAEESQQLDNIHARSWHKRVTSKTTGKETVFEEDKATVRKEFDLWEDEDETQRYRGQGINVVDPIP